MARNITFCTRLVFGAALLLILPGCNDVSSVSTPPGPGALTITTNSLPDGGVSTSYATAIGASGGTTPYVWSVSPALPPDLSFDRTTGAITGVPAASGTTSLTFALQDSSSPPQTAQKSLALTIQAPAVLTIATTSLAGGTVGKAYSETIRATGGNGTLTWSVIAGALPQNLGFDPATGAIAGIPTAAGPSSFTVQVADTTGQVDTQVLTILIAPANQPIIRTTSLPGGTVGLLYSQILTATGGTGTLVWSLASGSLPTNLALSPAGILSGTPTNTGTSGFTVRVTDALSQVALQPLSITVTGTLTITTISLPNATVGQSYNGTLQQAGGVPPMTWSATPPLPAGLTLEASTGVLSGTPAKGTEGTYTGTFSVKDSTLQNVSKAQSLIITRK